ncbi:MAG: hypothetical protein KJO50_04070, partial [Bacteroidia bacterium]|nr:hypothetical protein [Bacteroidia bacterium]
MRNLGYTYVYIFMICTLVNNLAYGQIDCSSTPKPANDLCQEAIPISGSVNGNTCCAGIESIDLCGSMENGIWYSFTPANNGSLIEISNLSIEGPIGIEFYSGSCTNLSLIEKSDCSGFESRSFSLPNCYAEVLIHITSFEDGCGEFEIQMSDINECTFAETCETIVPELEFNPISDGMQECISSCLQYACDSDCTSNGVWFQLNTDNDATQVQLSIINAGFEPVISFLRGNNCSDTDDIVVCEVLPEGQYLNLDVVPNTSYFIEVSYQNGIPGSFDLCISSVKDFIDCSSGSLTVSRPMFPTADPNGPYCPGETVLFCYDVEFHVDIPGTGNNCQWLQGII